MDCAGFVRRCRILETMLMEANCVISEEKAVLKIFAEKCFESELFKDFPQSLVIDRVKSGATVIKYAICEELYRLQGKDFPAN